MNCILKSCAHETFCRAFGVCSAAHALDLSRQRDGYLTAADNRAVNALHKAGLVTAKYVGDGCLIVKAVHNPSTLPPLRRDTAEKWARAAEMGVVRI